MGTAPSKSMRNSIIAATVSSTASAMEANPRCGWLLTRTLMHLPFAPAMALWIVSASRGQQEATLLHELQEQLQPRLARPPVPGSHQHRSSHIVALPDYFQISGPNG